VRRVERFRGLRVWSAFRHRNYRLFWFGQLVSLIGTWMQAVAQDWLVLQLTNNPFDLGLVAAVQFTPVMILGLFGGIIADHLPKRRTLIGTQVALMLLAFTMAALVVTGWIQVWHIFVLAFLLGCVNSFDMPTRQSFVVEMVGREDVSNAVALNSAMFNAARVVGPAVAGLAIGLFGVAQSFFLNGLSFLAVIAGLMLMRESELHAPPRIPRPTSVGHVIANLAEGLGYVRHTPVVLLAVVTVGAVSTFGINFSVSVPPMARDVLHADAGGYGLLMAAVGVGALVAALFIAAVARPSVWVLVGGAILLGVLEVAFAFSRWFPLSLACMFGVGFGLIGMAATANTLIQLEVPDGLRGRVMAVYLTVFAGSTPLGGIATGAVASAYGAAVAMGLAGFLSALAGIGGAIYVLRRSRARGAAPLFRPRYAEVIAPAVFPVAAAAIAQSPAGIAVVAVGTTVEPIGVPDIGRG
jgi:MFS family permease